MGSLLGMIIDMECGNGGSLECELVFVRGWNVGILGAALDLETCIY